MDISIRLYLGKSARVCRKNHRCRILHWIMVEVGRKWQGGMVAYAKKVD